MTSEQLQKDHSKIIKALQSDDSLTVIDAIEDLRVAGKTADLPILIELLHQSQIPEIKSKITGLLANLKEKDAVPLMVAALQDQKYATERKQLTSCCWENGLDYTHYLSLFVDLIINSDFLVAFEAYTVITNMGTTIDQAKIDTEIEKLDRAMSTTSDEKKALMLDVIDFLPSIGF